MNIVLIGFRGTGKSTLGKALAKETKRAFIDTDQIVTKFFVKKKLEKAKYNRYNST